MRSLQTAFPEGNVRIGLNTINPDWAEELYLATTQVQAAETDRFEAVISYRIFSYQKMNASLRKSEPSMERNSSVQDIDYLFANYHTKFPEGKMLYRAIELPYSAAETMTPNKYAKSVYSVGDEFQDLGFVSTSADSDFMLKFAAPRYAKRPHIVYEILAHKGLPILEAGDQKIPYRTGGLNLQGYEKEVLLERGSRFKVVNIKNVMFQHSYDEDIPVEIFGIPRRRTMTVVQVVQQ